MKYESWLEIAAITEAGNLEEFGRYKSACSVKDCDRTFLAIAFKRIQSQDAFNWRCPVHPTAPIYVYRLNYSKKGDVIEHMQVICDTDTKDNIAPEHEIYRKRDPKRDKKIVVTEEDVREIEPLYN